MGGWVCPPPRAHVYSVTFDPHEELGGSPARANFLGTHFQLLVSECNTFCACAVAVGAEPNPEQIIWGQGLCMYIQ